jgi:hypothetical protein
LDSSGNDGNDKKSQEVSHRALRIHGVLTQGKEKVARNFIERNVGLGRMLSHFPAKAETSNDEAIANMRGGHLSPV